VHIKIAIPLLTVTPASEKLFYKHCYHIKKRFRELNRYETPSIKLLGTTICSCAYCKFSPDPHGSYKI